jgi:peroxiredoxin-like protein
MEVRSKTYTYKTSVRWEGEKRGTIATQGKTDISVATPPEFKGPEGIWSPEDLFVASVNTCLMTTFLAFIDRAGLIPVEYQSDAEGKLELGSTGFSFTEITLRPTIVVKTEEDRTKARELIEKAEKNCLISNSIKSQVHLEATIVLQTPSHN